MSFKYIQLDKITENLGFIVFDRTDLNRLEEKIIKHLKGVKEEDLSKPIDEKLLKMLQEYEEKILNCELSRKVFNFLNLKEDDITYMEAQTLIEVIKELLFNNDLLSVSKKQIGVKDLNCKFHIPFNLTIIVDFITTINKEKSKEEIMKNLFQEIEMLNKDDKASIVIDLVSNFLSLNDREKVKEILVDKKVKLLIVSKTVDLIEEQNKNHITFITPKTLKEVDKEKFYIEIAKQIKEQSLQTVFVRMVENKVEKDKISEILDIPLIKNKIKQKDLTKIVEILGQ